MLFLQIIKRKKYNIKISCSMKKFERTILLNDLSSRLPYGVKCVIEGSNDIYTLNNIEVDERNGDLISFAEQKNGLVTQVYLSEVKPCLIPLKSISKELKEELDVLVLNDNTCMFCQYNGWFLDATGYSRVYLSDVINVIDFLKEHHIDYNHLIEKGLAVDATNLGIY